MSASKTVVGINFGGSTSSVAIISKEGLADCIANDDGERQISNAVSFSGEEEYVGIPAKSQLVRNNANTILGFRNLLGQKYDSVKSVKSQFGSAPIVAGSDGQPAYKVDINGTETTLSVQEVSKKYLTALIGFASDFLGRSIDAAVLAVPSDFTIEQMKALEQTCQEAAGVKVLQFLHEPAAAAVAYGLTVPTDEDDRTVTPVSFDRNVVVLDVGASSTTVTVLAARQGLYVPLATVRDSQLGGDAFDEQLIAFFSKEFTKKTKVTLDKSNHRAIMKLRLSCEITKRTLSASNSATCSVESLAEGMDFSGSINRSRFDLLSSKVYSSITSRITEALQQASVDPLDVQEVILVGGTCKNPTLAEKVSLLFPESTLVTSQIEPDQVIARGCVLHALALTKSSDEESAHIDHFSPLSKRKQQVTTAPIGILVPAPAQNGDAKANPAVVDGKLFVTVIDANTPLPARRIVDLPAGKDADAIRIILSEGKTEVHVESPPKKESNGKAADEDDEDEEEDEEDDVRTSFVKATTKLGELIVKVQKGQSKPSVRLTVIVSKDGKLEVEAQQNGVDNAQVQSFQS